MISRRIIAAVALLCVFIAPAHAQKTKAALTAEINANWPDNNIGTITPAALRSTVIDIVNSYIDANGGSSLPCATHQWIAAIATLSSVTCTQPEFSDLSGSIAPSQIPTPTATTLGGIESIISLSHNWIAYIDTSGVPHQSQPSFSDISGTLGFSQGGCNATSQTACTNNIFPTPTRAGDIIYWTGTAWVTLAGNNSGNQVLQENSSGVPSWVAASGTGTVTSVSCGTGLTGGTFTASGTCAIDYTRNNTWTGDGLFASGRPWCDVRSQGAVGNGSTDDTAAFNACLTLLISTKSYGSGTIYVPPSANVYCVKGGFYVNTGVTTNGGIILQGGGVQGTALSACGANVTVVRYNNQWGSVRDLSIYGYGSQSTDAVFSGTAPTVPAFQCDPTNGSEFSMRNVYITGGVAAAYLACAGYDISNLWASYAYGDGSHYFAAVVQGGSGTGGYLHHSHIDQAYPVSQPAHNSTISAWAATTSVTAGQIRTVTCNSRSWWIQVKTSGTTGSSQPACQPYNTNITDGSAVWLLVNATTSYCAQIDSGTNDMQWDSVDMSCAAGYNLGLTSTFGTADPTEVTFTSITPGGGINGVVTLNAGSHVTFSGSRFSGCVVAGCQAIVTSGNFAGPLVIVGNRFYNGLAYCVDISQGSSLSINDNICNGSDTVGVNIFGGISNFIVNGNIFAPSSGNGWTVASGASNHYVIQNNVCNGAGTSDGGSGGSKSVGTCF